MRERAGKVTILTLGAALMILFLCAPELRAEGTYFIDKDENGVFIQTSQDGGWYLDESDLQVFTVGDKGGYFLARDREGMFLQTGKKKIYVDYQAYEEWLREIDEFNAHQARERETEVIVRNNQVLVPVTIGHNGKKIRSHFLLDTGSSITLLPAELAKELRIKPTEKVQLGIVGGGKLDAEVAELDQLQLGPVKRKNLYVGILDHVASTSRFDGILGIDFFQGQKYQLNFEKQVIEWDF